MIPKRVSILLLLLWAATISTAEELILSSVRSIDGTDGNEGAAHGARLVRMAGADYPGDGTGAIIKQYPDFPNPRTISNVCVKQHRSVRSKKKMTDFVWAFGQFLE